MGMNNCILQGNLTRDVELKSLANGTAVANVGIAVNHSWTSDGEKKEEVNFFDLEAWSKTAEFLNKYFSKGKPILVRCRAKLEQWENDGEKRQKVKFVIEEIQFAGGPKSEKDSDEEESSPPKKNSSSKQESAKSNTKKSSSKSSKSSDDDEVPF